jgi:hypothetical protein
MNEMTETRRLSASVRQDAIPTSAATVGEARTAAATTKTAAVS